MKKYNTMKKTKMMNFQMQIMRTKKNILLCGHPPLLCSFSTIKQGIATQLIPSLSRTMPAMNPNKRDNMKTKIKSTYNRATKTISGVRS
jgi:hypothetical protein